MANQTAEIAWLKAELGELRTTSGIRSDSEEQVRATSQEEQPATAGFGEATTKQYMQATRRPATASQAVQFVDPPIDGEQSVDCREYKQARKHRARAPPVDPFIGENLETQLDDWLRALEVERVDRRASPTTGTGQSVTSTEPHGSEGSADLGGCHSSPLQPTVSRKQGNGNSGFPSQESRRQGVGG